MPRSRLLAVTLLAAAALFSLVSLVTLTGPPAEPTTSEQKAPGAASVALPNSQQAQSAQAGEWAAQTASLLASTDAPGRDLISITQRIKLGGNGFIPRTVNASPPNYAAGTRHAFNIADLQKKNYYTISATLREVTAHAYWYVRDGYAVNLAALKAAAAHFEAKVYPTSRRIFGSEPSPGTDNDPRITVLIAPMSGVNGYFSSADTFPKVVNPFSNEREMIYISTRPEGDPSNPDNKFQAVLAHELQHMIHFNVHRDRDVWLDEGCSEIAVDVNGYTVGGFDYLFTLSPDTQLNAWAGEPGKSAAHYGASYLFLRYLMDRYGGEKFLTTLLNESGLGTGAVDAAVKTLGNPVGFEGAFKDWVVANSLNDPGIAGGRYSYSQGGRVPPGRVLQRYPATRSESVHQYAADYIKLSGTLGPATITFKGSPTAKVLAAGPHSGQAYWYSNRRDSGDATLTRELDLTRAGKATLQFWAWYDVEYSFDYAYLLVSTDNGKSWTPQKGKYTTTDNPNGASFGHAWSGKSGYSGNSTAKAKWVQEQVDLSAFAGKRVLVRFEYITDEGYNAPGFAVDDLRVSEIGYSDNAESDGGWDAEGFVRIGNVMPQRWFVALIENASTPRVREITVDANGQATLSIEGFGRGKAVRDATLVIAPLAPKTTETATYNITVRKK